MVCIIKAPSRNIVVLEGKNIRKPKQLPDDLEHLFSLSLDIICMAGDGYFKRLNPAWENALGFGRDELLSRPYLEFVHPEARTFIPTQMQQAIAGAEILNFENRYRCKDGSYKWFSWRCKVLIEEQCVYEVARDITQQKQMEPKLQQSNERIINILERIPDAFIALDEQWKFTYINTEAVRQMQRNWEDAIDKCLWDEFPELVDTRCYEEFHKSMSEKVTVKFEDFNSYTQQWFAVQTYPISDGIAVYFNDITEQKRTEEALQRSEQTATTQLEQMAKVNYCKDDLTTVSHELRTPIANIKMGIQMLAIALDEKQALLPETANNLAQQDKIARYLQMINEQCERQINLINNLLDLQRLNAIEPLTLETIYLETWLAMLSEPFQERTINRNQTLDIDLPLMLPPLVSNRASLERILAELLNNACKYTPPGERITLKVNLQPQTIQFSVINTGVEIPTSELSRIFDSFYRIRSLDRWQQGGNGLGLALVKKLAEHLKGRVWVERKQGMTCFTVELPLNMSDLPGFANF